MASLDDSSALPLIYFCAALPAVVWFLVRRRRLLLVCLDLWPQFEHNGAHTCPVLERSPSLMVHFVGVYFTPNDAGGSPPLGAASLGRVATAETVCGLRCFAAVGRQLLRTMVSIPSICVIPREKALTRCMKFLAPAWVVRAATRAQRDRCAPTFRDSFYPQRVCLSVKTPNETRTREEWGLVRRIAKPRLSPRAVSYLTMCRRR